MTNQAHYQITLLVVDWFVPCLFVCSDEALGLTLFDFWLEQSHTQIQSQPEADLDGSAPASTTTTPSLPNPTITIHGKVKVKGLELTNLSTLVAPSSGSTVLDQIHATVIPFRVVPTVGNETMDRLFVSPTQSQTLTQPQTSRALIAQVRGAQAIGDHSVEGEVRIQFVSAERLHVWLSFFPIDSRGQKWRLAYVYHTIPTYLDLLPDHDDQSDDHSSASQDSEESDEDSGSDESSQASLPSDEGSESDTTD